MTADQWQRHIVWAVCRAAHSHPERLIQLAQTLADAETARESLICAGFGSDDFSLGDLVAQVVEAKMMRDGLRPTSR